MAESKLRTLFLVILYVALLPLMSNRQKGWKKSKKNLPENRTRTIDIHLQFV